MVLAMINWVEKGVAPDTIIGAKYIGDDKRNGTAFERPHCVYVEPFLLSLAPRSPCRPSRLGETSPSAFASSSHFC